VTNPLDSGVRISRRSDVLAYLLLAALPLQDVNIKTAFITVSGPNMVLLTLTGVIVLGAIARRRITRTSGATVTLAIFLWLSLLPILTAERPLVSVREVVTLAGGVLMAWVVSHTINNKKRISNALKAMTVSAVIISGVTILIGIGVLSDIPIGLGATRARHATPVFGISLPIVRNTGVMPTQGTYGIYISIVLTAQLLVVVGLDKSQLICSRWVAIPSTLIIIAGVLVTQSRTVWVGVLVVLGVVLAFRWVDKGPKGDRLLKAVTLVIVLAALVWVFAGIAEYYAFDIRAANTLSRLEQYSYALSSIVRKPFLGTGNADIPIWVTGDPALHNSFLQIAMSRGVFAFIVFFMVFVGCATWGYRKTRKTNGPDLRVLGMWVFSAMSAIFVQSNLYPGMSDKGMWAMIGLGLAVARLSESEGQRSLCSGGAVKVARG